MISPAIASKIGRTLLCIPACLAALLTGIGESRGQAPAAVSEDPAPVLFETATVRARPLATTTQSVTILEREEIEALDVVSVAELIRFIPGLDLESNGPRGGLATAKIRGGDPNFTVVLLDGVPLNDSTDQLRGGAVNLNSLPTSQIERIEVIRGTLSSFFGSAALGGVINIVTRRGGSDEPAYRVELGAGDDSVVQAAAALSGAKDERDYYLGVSWEQEEDRIAEDAFEQLSLQGNLRLPVGESADLRLTGRVTAWESEDYPDASGGPLLGPGQTRRTDHDEASLAVEWHFGEADRRHRIHVTAYRHELSRQTPANPLFEIPTSVEDTAYTNLRTGWTFPLIEPGKTQLNIGVEAGRESGENDSTFFVAPGFELPGSYRIDRSTGAAFVEFVAERGPLQYELGGRLDVPEGFDAELSPRAGIAYRFPEGRTRLRASAGRGFKLPSFFVLASPDLLGGNPDLDPEIALGADLGLEHRSESARVTASLTLFAYRYEDLITFDFPEGLPPRAVNEDEVKSRGVELALDWTPTEALAVQVNATRQDVEDGDGEEFINRPEWVAGARLGWNAREGLRWTLDGQWVSESRDVRILDRETTAGYQLYGTALSYRIAPGWELHARVDNLADKEYETFIGFPGAGRSFRIGVRHRSR